MIKVRKQYRWICSCQRINDAGTDKCIYCGSTRPKKKKAQSNSWFDRITPNLSKAGTGTVVRVKDTETVSKSPLSNNSYAHVHRGTYSCSKGEVFFRSLWEANYSLYLDFLVKQGQIKDWEYESDRFMFEKIKLGTRSYTPDFKIINNDGSVEYHETKGFMDSRSKTKLKRMRIYFPDVKMVLIERKEYSEILKKLKGIIKFY